MDSSINVQYLLNTIFSSKFNGLTAIQLLPEVSESMKEFSGRGQCQHFYLERPDMQLNTPGSLPCSKLSLKRDSMLQGHEEAVLREQFAFSHMSTGLSFSRRPTKDTRDGERLQCRSTAFTAVYPQPVGCPNNPNLPYSHSVGCPNNPGLPYSHSVGRPNNTGLPYRPSTRTL